MIEQLQDQLKQSYQQVNAINEKKNMAEASLSQLSCGSEAIVIERNSLLEKVNEIQVRYDQIRPVLALFCHYFFFFCQKWKIRKDVGIFC